MVRVELGFQIEDVKSRGEVGLGTGLLLGRREGRRSGVRGREMGMGMGRKGLSGGVDVDGGMKR